MARSYTVEVELSDFDDDAILEAARDIGARRGLSEFDLSSELVADLAAHIVRHETASALLLLDRLVEESPALRNAVEVGRRRAR